MKFLPSDISTFAKMIKEGYLYVDKTEQIANLFEGGRRYFFLSRPRRFGKSLLISTLESLFKGKKELFKDLWIGKQQTYEWQEHPVITLDFSLAEYTTPEELKKSLTWMLDQHAQEYNIDISEGNSPKTKLELVVKELAKKNSVVFLVDEYDKPILDHLHNPKKANAQREVLKSFYDGFKGLDKYMRCIFITGVSKFSKTSIFSGLNNLNEISYDPIAADLVGYTEQEVTQYYAPYLEECANNHSKTCDEILQKVRHWYNGYQFSEKALKVYNPYTITYFFQNQEFKNYWFASGTPTLLIENLKKDPFKLQDIETKAFSIGTLGTFLIEKIPLETLFFQTGYLTIKEYDQEFDLYRLGYPNEEVRQSLAILQFGALSGTEEIKVSNVLYQLQYALKHKDLETFVQGVRTLFSKIPYNLHINKEAYYHSLLQLLCTILGANNYAELKTSKGRIDLIIETTNYLYLLEFKFNASTDKALQQILDKKYYEPFMNNGKEIIPVGINFSYEDKELQVDWLEGKLPN